MQHNYKGNALIDLVGDKTPVHIAEYTFCLRSASGNIIVSGSCKRPDARNDFITSGAVCILCSHAAVQHTKNGLFRVQRIFGAKKQWPVAARS